MVQRSCQVQVHSSSWFILEREYWWSSESWSSDLLIWSWNGNTLSS